MNLIQAERTLDEAYYPSLDREALKARNNDQVVSKEYRQPLKGESFRPILMVPQFWIWKFEDHILSAYSTPGKRKDRKAQSEYDPGKVSIFDHQGWKSENSIGVSTSLAEHSDPDLHIGLLLAIHIDNFGKAQANDTFQSPLDIFQIGVVQVLSRVSDFIKQPTSIKPDDIKKERDFINDISDIRNELAMVDEILRQQKQIMDSIIRNANAEGKDRN